MELPAYHAPSAGNVLRATWERGWSFIKRAGTVILISSIILWFLQGYGFVDGVFQAVEDNNDSLLAVIGNAVAWIFYPLGWMGDMAWKATVATVTGLIAKNANDEYVRYNASKGVILACGGYSGNETMMNALQPQSVEQTCINYSKPGAKGDGIKACLWAGAIMDQTHTSMIFDRGAIKPDQTGEYGKASDGALFWMGSQPFLKVNLNGERFMNEYMPYDLVLHAAASQPYHTYCTVWDSKYPEDVEHFATHGCSRLYPHANGTAPVFPIEYIEGMNADLQDQGYIVQADTVEELADKLGLPKDTFTATVDRYNELAAKGEDEDYGKEDYRLSTLSEAPFYGVRQAGGYLICTIDGIQIDDNMHAIDQDFKAIPGLYVIGDMSGNYFSGSYPSLMAGAAAGRSATFGRFAGQNAAAGI